MPLTRTLSALVALAFLFAVQALPGQTVEESIQHWDAVLAGTSGPDETLKVGDMQLTAGQLQALRDMLAREAGLPTPKAATGPGINQWTGGIVSYYFDIAGVANEAKKKQAFRDAAAEWRTFANLTFVELATAPGAATSYIRVTENPAPGAGGEAAVGMIAPSLNGQLFSIGVNAWTRGTLLHELGHSLGLLHEHQRSDRDTYVTVRADLLANGNYALMTTTTTPAYDFLSVMHYAGDSSGANSIVAKPGFEQFQDIMGREFDRCLSKLDRQTIATMYGAQPIPYSATVTNTNDAGPGSLRAALYYSFDTPGTEIKFNIPSGLATNVGGGNYVFIIRPSGLLTRPGDGTTINGASQATFLPTHVNSLGPEIVITGTELLDYGDGLRLTDHSITIRNLVINSFSRAGLYLTGSDAYGNFIEGCYIGLDHDGATAKGNSLTGIYLDTSVSDNVIGGVDASARNVISGNSGAGIYLNATGANTIVGNYIGTNAAGTLRVPNSTSGIHSVGSNGLIIGGGGMGNLISGNGDSGIVLDSTGTSQIKGNIIGLNHNGTGILTNNIPGTGSLGNAFAGIYLANSDETIIGGTTSTVRNYISDNGSIGIFMVSSDHCTIQGNYIGTDITGELDDVDPEAIPPTDFGNGYDGIQMQSSDFNQIGGTTTGAGNLISGNGGNGIHLYHNSELGDPCDDNIIEGNIIGLDVDGEELLGNDGSGMVINAGDRNRIGGPLSGARNLISDNGEHGVFLLEGADQTIIQGNYIGTDITGLKDAIIPPTVPPTDFGNSYSGIYVVDSTEAQIGGTTTLTRNLLSGNGQDGVVMDHSSNSHIFGNYIGVDINGTADLGNTNSGVYLLDSSAITIGGTTVVERNIISGNNNGVTLFGSTNNTIAANYIGLNFAGTTAIGNDNMGIYLANGSNENLIGSTVEAGANLISGNGWDGIQIWFSADNDILGNGIGMDSTRSAARPNGRGIAIIGDDSTGNRIGSNLNGARNQISGNSSEGISLINGASYNFIQGNYIGTGVSGQSTLPNNTGISLFSTTSETQDELVGNVIGGPDLGQGNVISGNSSSGIAMFGFVTDTTVEGNNIGRMATGSNVLGNDLTGIYMTVGGQTFGPTDTYIHRNLIIGHTSEGIYLDGAEVLDNTISRNSIYFTGTYGGIYIGAGNHTQPAPQLTSATATTGVSVSGTLDTVINNESFVIEFFANSINTTFPEGERFLGSINVITDGSGDATINANLTAVILGGQYITATATRVSTGDTSNFSNSVAVGISDSDGDNLPNAYEALFPGGSATPGGDQDGDGYTNLDEYYAGTNPLSGSERFQLDIDWMDNTALAQLKLSTKAGRVYTISRAASLTSQYFPIGLNIVGTGGVQLLDDPGSNGVPLYYYKATVAP